MPQPFRSNLWADVFPRDAQLRKYFYRVMVATIPFLGIAVLAQIIDRFTHFPIEIGVTTYEVGGGVLGVFLLLRTNSGYDRWWEARKLWGGITNQSRSMASAAVAYGTNEAWKSEFVQTTILFAHATRRHLRQERDLPEAEKLLGREVDRTWISGSHLPLKIALRMALLLRDANDSGQLPAAVLMQMERERIALLDHLGGCERILKTPLPQIYNTVIRQFLVVFLIAFPFGILQKVTWLTPFVTGFVALPMLALDEIGTELQNPFSTRNINHLPLDGICQTIEDNLLGLLPARMT